jgi:hypothetical protein
VGTARDLGQLLALLRRRQVLLGSRERSTLAEGLAPVIRDVEAHWHQAQAAVAPALAGLDRSALLEAGLRALRPDEAPSVTAP